MNQRVFEYLWLDTNLRKALENDQLVIHYQPKITWRGEVRSLEALVRWQSPERGLIPPLDFISYAEESGLIVPLGRYGHLFGDQLLRDVSLAILSCLEHDQVLARPGGDEFLVLASNTSQSALEAMASRILTRLRLPFRIGLIEVYTSCSVGISLSPEHGSDSATIIRHADTAMYTAKEGGRGQFCVF
ncbi:TPA: diguanylate cyclase, partial [Shigella sonnei]|nr:diguanylate cyclase [Shigella sonnei]